MQDAIETLPPRREGAFVGRVLADKYRLDAELGAGGMGVVLRGVHLVTGRAIAVKILRADDDESARRFLREARIAAALDHPNVVGVLDFGTTEDGLAFQVLELLEGESLRERLERGPLSPTRTLELALPLLHALEAAHVRDVVHRDLKPGNVFLARNKHGRIVPKLLDFGIARVRGPVRAAVATGPIPTPTTQAGMILGTPAYMSPEQARGEAVTKASDLFSFGAMLFECVTGEVPFDGVNPNVVMARIVLERARRVGDVAPAVPDGIARAIDVALCPEPKDRPPSAAALASLLRAGAEAAGLAVPAVGTSDCAEEDPELATTLVHTPRRPEPVPAPSVEPARPRRPSPSAHASTHLWAVALLGLFVLTATIAFVWTRHQSAPSGEAAAPDAARGPDTSAERGPETTTAAEEGGPAARTDVAQELHAPELARGALPPSLATPREHAEVAPRPSRPTHVPSEPVHTDPAPAEAPASVTPADPDTEHEATTEDGEALPQLHEW